MQYQNSATPVLKCSVYALHAKYSSAFICTEFSTSCLTVYDYWIGSAESL
jgi:hypothetical protein